MNLRNKADLTSRAAIIKSACVIDVHFNSYIKQLLTVKLYLLGLMKFQKVYTSKLKTIATSPGS